MTDLKARVLDKKLTPFERITLLMSLLRSPEGCAWDRKQTHKSLLPYLIEEAYEVVEVIESGRYEDLREELGDLLCQVVFHAQLASERGDFDINDSINLLVDKLIQRHPHVFGEKRKLSPQQVRDQWELIKTRNVDEKTVLSGLPRSMPALTMAFRIGEKAGGVGFDWNNPVEVLQKIDEEILEIKQELERSPGKNKESLTNEIGDLLFATASLARKLDIEPETALRTALGKFRKRFEKLEKRVVASGGGFDDYTLVELENIWQQVKKE
ncbi:MAG: nucleoside triphosphate pyrophosphohydrolase [candidate division Zixibacteria bacterium]|nr:nucleoside triphosphate pyrophosphohydrolase [candidate division Zixibacteria bacterium]